MSRQDQVRAAQAMVRKSIRADRHEARSLLKSAAVAYAAAGLTGLAAWCERQAAKLA